MKFLRPALMYGNVFELAKKMVSIKRLYITVVSRIVDVAYFAMQFCVK